MATPDSAALDTRRHPAERAPSPSPSTASTAPAACSACAAPASPASRIWGAGLVAALAWAGFGAIARLWPNRIVGFSDWAYTEQIGTAGWAIAALIRKSVV